MSEAKASPGRISFTPQEGGGYVVYRDGDRIGFVRKVGPGAWAATDTYLVDLRGAYATRGKAVDAILRRRAREERG